MSHALCLPNKYRSTQIPAIRRALKQNLSLATQNSRNAPVTSAELLSATWPLLLDRGSKTLCICSKCWNQCPQVVSGGLFTYTHIHLYIYTYMYIYIYKDLYICTYTCYIYIYVYIYGLGSRAFRKRSRVPAWSGGCCRWPRPCQG